MAFFFVFAEGLRRFADLIQVATQQTAADLMQNTGMFYLKLTC